MYKTVIPYEDWDGTEKTAECRFHLTKGELLKLNLRYGGDIKARLEELAAREDWAEIIELMENIVLTAYGEKCRDSEGREVFRKDEERKAAFRGSEAYSELMVRLMQPEYLKEFLLGVVPVSLSQAVQESPAYQEFLAKMNAADQAAT